MSILSTLEYTPVFPIWVYITIYIASFYTIPPVYKQFDIILLRDGVYHQAFHKLIHPSECRPFSERKSDEYDEYI